jgi:hypothetical protein
MRGVARVRRLGMAWIGRDWSGRHGAEGVAGTRKGWSGRHGPVRSERPSREGVAGMASRGLARSGLDRHGRHGFVGTAWPGQFWQARRVQAWKVRYGWLGVVGLGQGTAGKASVGTVSLGMAGEVTRAWLGLGWRTLQASLGAEGQARLAGVARVVWNGGDSQARRDEARSDRGTAGRGRHGQEGRDRQARKGVA